MPQIIDWKKRLVHDTPSVSQKPNTEHTVFSYCPFSDQWYIEFYGDDDWVKIRIGRFLRNYTEIAWDRVAEEITAALGRDNWVARWP